MQIEIYIDGEKRLFTAPFVPMLAKRKYLELMAKAEQREEEPTFQEQLEEDDEMVSILADIVFDKQFTVEQLYKGASGEYVYRKLREAIFGLPEMKEEDTGNEMGE